MSDWLDELQGLEQECEAGSRWSWEYAPATSTDAIHIVDYDGDEPGHVASLNMHPLGTAALITALRNNASELISCARRAQELEREITWLKESLGSVERKLSLVRHRRNVFWGEDGLPEAYDVDVAIGKARRLAYEEDA